MKYLLLSIILIACTQQPTKTITEEKVIYRDTSMAYVGIIDSGINCIDCCPNRLMITDLLDKDLVPSGKIMYEADGVWYLKEIENYSVSNDSLVIAPVNCGAWNGHKFKIPLMRKEQ